MLPVRYEDLVFHILHGLPFAYDAFKTSIWTRSGSITVDELIFLLCSEVIHIDSVSKLSSSHDDLTVAYSTGVTGKRGFASHQPNFRGSYSSFRGRTFSRNGYHGGRFNSRGGHRGFGRNSNSFGNRGFGVSHSGGNFSDHSGGGYNGGGSLSGVSSSNSILCQICNKPNHTAWNCWHRMDSSFQPSLMTYPPQSSTKAFVASSALTSVPDWFVDSAATHHLTNDLYNMHLYQPYTGPEQVLVGNGSTLPIQHSGKGILPTPTHSFRLNQVLHVPSLTSNLVSIQQLTKDNNCSITFDDSSFFV